MDRWFLIPRIYEPFLSFAFPLNARIPEPRRRLSPTSLIPSYEVSLRWYASYHIQTLFYYTYMMSSTHTTVLEVYMTNIPVLTCL